VRECCLASSASERGTLAGYSVEDAELIQELRDYQLPNKFCCSTLLVSEDLLKISGLFVFLTLPSFMASRFRLQGKDCDYIRSSNGE